MESEATGPGQSFFAALDDAEPLQATEALRKMSVSIHPRNSGAIDLRRAWTSFQRLLERRGFFVEAPDRLAQSLREIESIGPGFDLYDLARSLASYDRLSGARAIPELAAFVQEKEE